MGSARKWVGRAEEPCAWVRGCLGGRTCWVALLDSPDAGALRRGGRRRCWFELVEDEGVIALVTRLLRMVDTLCKNGVAIYGIQVVTTAQPRVENSQGKGTEGATHASKDRRV